VPLTTPYPSSSRFPSATVYPSQNSTIFSVGIPSTLALGKPDALPRRYALPSSLRTPGSSAGLRVILFPRTVGGIGFSRATVFGVATFFEIDYHVPARFEPVGEPRHGLRAGPGRYPGASLSGSQFLYSRIAVPSSSARPKRGQLPARTDFTPRALTGYSIVTNRDELSVSTDASFHRFVATFEQTGHFNAFGVFSSDLSAKLPVMVEMSDGVTSVELADGNSLVELAPTLAIEVEVE
jgi:hypothetical protein